MLTHGIRRAFNRARCRRYPRVGLPAAAVASTSQRCNVHKPTRAIGLRLALMPTAISRQIDLDQLVLPPEDVRQGRPEDEILSIASSMGDPEIGQQQPISVYPHDYPEVVEDGNEAELVDLFEDGHNLVIHDGVSRYRAAQKLGWTTIWGVISPEPPENDVVARLEANTERIDMSDFEVYSALFDLYEGGSMTLEDVGEKIGVSESYVSRVFSLFDGPEWLVEAWKHDGHPLNTSHAIAVSQMLNSNNLERYQEAGDLTAAEARERAQQDARLMIDVQGQHDLGVGEFRERCKRCRKETLDQLSDGRDAVEKQTDGMNQAADRKETPPPDEVLEPCMVCGSDRPMNRRKSIPVCAEDYGMLADMESRGDVLLANADVDGETRELPADQLEPREMAVSGLSQELDVTPEQALQIIQAGVQAVSTDGEVQPND